MIPRGLDLYNIAMELVAVIKSCDSFFESCADEETTKSSMVAMGRSVEQQIANADLDLDAAPAVNGAINSSSFSAEIRKTLAKAVADSVMKVFGSWHCIAQFMFQCAPHHLFLFFC